MRNALFTLTLIAFAVCRPMAALADSIDDFVLIGGGNTITFSLMASPPGNLTTCPVPALSCLPGAQTAFYLTTPVTTNGTTTTTGLSFPTFYFEGGLSIGMTRFFGPQLFLPDAAYPTFDLGSFNLDTYPSSGTPPFVPYVLTITPESSTVVPEPSTLALLAAGALSLLGFSRIRRRLA